MTPWIMHWLQHRARPEVAARPRGPIVEIGSLNVNGSARQALGDLGDPYVGLDRQAGPGVDLVEDIGALADRVGAWAGTVISTEALEHDPTFWKTLEGMRRISRPGALWIITTPANGFPYHGYPNDYYRFTGDAYRDVFFEGMHILGLSEVAPPGEPAWERAVCGIAERRE